MYPNPTTGNVTMLYHLSEVEGTLQIFDVAGRSVASYNLNGKRNEFEFNIASLCCGVFECRVFDGDKLQGRAKLVIIR
jgi:hypothetical protein